MAGEYTGAMPLVPGTNLTNSQVGRAYRIGCSSAGWFRLIMLDGSNYDVYANQGQGGEDGIQILGVASSANTPSPAGAGTVSVLK